jgi:putative tryptophan/tyrosine transport system substrate-binding protein
VIAVGRKARIPVFSITPGKPDRGTLFDYGADFYQIGRQTGTLAANILHGADPTKIPIKNEVPINFVVNTTALTGLRQRWQIPEKFIERANTVVDAAGVHHREPYSKPASTK